MVAPSRPWTTPTGDRHDDRPCQPHLRRGRRPGRPALDPLPPGERRAPGRDLRRRPRIAGGLSRPEPGLRAARPRHAGMDGLEVFGAPARPRQPCPGGPDHRSSRPGHPGASASVAGVPLVEKPLAFDALLGVLADGGAGGGFTARLRITGSPPRDFAGAAACADRPKAHARGSRVPSPVRLASRIAGAASGGFDPGQRPGPVTARFAVPRLR